jgi:hypothetical protein
MLLSKEYCQLKNENAEKRADGFLPDALSLCKISDPQETHKSCKPTA